MIRKYWFCFLYLSCIIYILTVNLAFIVQGLHISKLDSIQFGFTKRRSTNETTAMLMSHILGALGGSQDTVRIFYDTSKAFDSADHDSVLLKLKY